MGVRNKKDKKYEWYPGGSNHGLYPAEIFAGDFHFGDGSVYIPFSFSFGRRWGQGGSMHLLNSGNLFPAPDSIAIAWYSIVENRFYEVCSALPKNRIEELLWMKDPENPGEQLHYFIVAGMAPYGGLAVWVSGSGSVTEVAWLQGEEAIDIDISDYWPAGNMSGEEYAQEALRSHDAARENFLRNGLPDRELFNRYMQRFKYRIVPEFENPDVRFEIITVWYYNGEIDPVPAGVHDSYTAKAKPYRIAIKWYEGEDTYHGYFWTDENGIVNSFDEFFSDQQQAEYVIEISSSNMDYGFALRNGDKYLEIPEEEREFIIFKNEQELGRYNYDREQGGWRH